MINVKLFWRWQFSKKNVEHSLCWNSLIQNAKTLKWRYWASLLQAQISLTSPCQFHLLLILRRVFSSLRKEANAKWNSPSLSPTTSFLVSNTQTLFGKLALEVRILCRVYFDFFFLFFLGGIYFNWLHNVDCNLFFLVTVDSRKKMLGTFSPQQEPYTFELEEETIPSGMFVRGTYAARTKVK